MNAQKMYHALLSLFMLSLPMQGESAFRFIVYGGSSGISLADPYNADILGYINTQITQLNPRPAFVIFNGNTVFAGTGAAPGYMPNYLQLWKSFMDSTLDGIPYYNAPGNRDLYAGDWPPDKQVAIIYQTTFSNLPDNGPSAPIDYRQLAYSFEYGSGNDQSLFLVLDAFGWGKDGDPDVNYDNGYDQELIDWFHNSAAQNANHKFAISHGPIFSPEKWPVDYGTNQIWQTVEEYAFDAFYCGHEHIYARWNINQSAYLPSRRQITQILTCDAGAIPDDPNLWQATSATPIYFGYNFLVVDVDGNKVKQHAYKVIPNGSGSYYTEPLDIIISLK